MTLFYISSAIRASSPIMLSFIINHIQLILLFAVTSGAVDRPTYSGSDVPPQDVFDNQFAKAPPPSAPPADMFAHYSGYENTQYGEQMHIDQTLVYTKTHNYVMSTMTG